MKQINSHRGVLPEPEIWICFHKYAFEIPEIVSTLSLTELQTSFLAKRSAHLMKSLFQQSHLLPIIGNQSHCVKSVRIRCYSSLHFPSFGLNMERYTYLSVLSPNVGKCGLE